MVLGELFVGTEEMLGSSDFELGLGGSLGVGALGGKNGKRD
jgi:hypothetical protein